MVIVCRERGGGRGGGEEERKRGRRGKIETVTVMDGGIERCVSIVHYSRLCVGHLLQTICANGPLHYKWHTKPHHSILSVLSLSLNLPTTHSDFTR